MSSKPDQFGDPHKGLAANQMGEAAGQVPLAFALEPSPQKIGDDKAQNSVTEEFEALVTANGTLARTMPATSLDRAQHARMGQGFLEDFRPGKVIPDYLREAFPRQKSALPRLNRRHGTTGRTGSQRAISRAATTALLGRSRRR